MATTHVHHQKMFFLRLSGLGRDRRGSTLVEAAFAVPMLITLLMGIMGFGSWFMTAHSLQQAANDAARASVAGLSTSERRSLVDQSVVASRGAFPAPGAQTISVSTQESSSHYTVTLSYNLSNAPLFSAIPFPLAGGVLQRSAVVRMSTP